MLVRAERCCLLVAKAMLLVAISPSKLVGEAPGLVALCS
jgi:hypothetical protein